MKLLRGEILICRFIICSIPLNPGIQYDTIIGNRHREVCIYEEKDMFIIIYFDREICASIKKLMPETPVYIIIGGAPGEEFRQTVQFALDNGLDGVDFAFVWGREWVRLTQ